MDRLKDSWYYKDEKEIERYKHLIMVHLDKKELAKYYQNDAIIKKYREKMNKLHEGEDYFHAPFNAVEDAIALENTEREYYQEVGVKNVAKKMLDNNMPIDLVIKYTGLPSNDKFFKEYMEKNGLNEEDYFHAPFNAVEDAIALENTERQYYQELKSKEIAKKMLDNNMPIDLVIKCTGLPINDKFFKEYMEKNGLNEEDYFHAPFNAVEDAKALENTQREYYQELKLKEIAKKMLAKKMPINEITELTNLSIEEINKLKEENINLSNQD